MEVAVVIIEKNKQTNNEITEGERGPVRVVNVPSFF